ncbi:Hypothetical protein PHPALM_696, partial [Phytophthora palmivora]
MRCMVICPLMSRRGIHTTRLMGIALTQALPIRYRHTLRMTRVNGIRRAMSGQDRKWSDEA